MFECTLATRAVHEWKSGEINRAFSPLRLHMASVTQADGLGWDNGAPLALSFAGSIGTFPVRVAVQLGLERFVRLPFSRT